MPVISPTAQLLKTLYPVSSRFLPHDLEGVDVYDLSGFLRDKPETCLDRPFLADLAAIEYARYNPVSDSCTGWRGGARTGGQSGLGACACASGSEDC